MEENKNKQVKPDNFLIWAILATVTCTCAFPLGIVAIVYANKVDSLWYAEKYEEANEALKKAKMWTFITVGVGVLGWIITMFFSIIIPLFMSAL